MKNTSFNKTEGFWEKNAELIPILAILAVMGLGIVAYAVNITKPNESQFFCAVIRGLKREGDDP